MTTSTNLGFDLIEQAQAQKEVTANEALMRIDSLLNTGVVTRLLNTPPATPSTGALYIVGTAPTGVWSGQALSLAWFDATWIFLAPREGLTLWVNDEDMLYSFNGAAWIASAGSSFANLSGVGIGALPDATNLLVVASNAVLFNAGSSGGTQIKVNKANAAATGSYLFQTAYSGRAEFGLIGGDDFSLKVSSDGSTFNQAFAVDRATGNLDMKKQFSASGSNFRKMLTLRPGNLRPQASNGCADVTTLNLGAGMPDIATFNFNASTAQYAQVSLPMPKNWNNGTITAQFLWSHAATSGAYGVVWSAAALATGDLDNMAASFGTAIPVSDTGGAANTLYISPESAAITVAGSPMSGDALWIVIARVAADAADTLAIDARLHGVRLYYTQSGFGDE